MMWRASITLTVCCVVTACAAAPPGPPHLFSFSHIRLQSLHPRTAEALPGVVVLYGSLVDKYVFLGVIPIGETTSVSYIESLYCSQNVPCDDLLVPAGRCHYYEAARATTPCTTARGAWLAVSSAEGGGCCVSASLQ